MSNSLPKQSFIALAAVGWADGSIHRTEAAGLVEAAKKLGLSGDDLAAVEGSTKTPVSLEAFDPGDMSTWNRVLTYALASWLARIDGVQSTSETDTLKKLGERLALEAPVRERAAAAAFDVWVLPEGGKPAKFDFEKLIAKLKERLPKIAAG